ncbi:MAG TPA: hypothetical protein VEW04_07990 [Allosphingosinicella sp.]|nr:hypothetical protein [Allosphingosinicella sp.]
MRTMLLSLSAATIALATPLYAQGHGGGHGGGQGHGQRAGGDNRGNGHQGRGADDAQRGRGHQDRDVNRNPGRGEAQRIAGDDHHGRGHDRADRGHGRGDDRVRGPAHVRNEDVLLPGARQDDRGRGRGHDVRRAGWITNQGDISRVRWEPSHGLMRGCPPGLARKHNGCLPPGQARHLAERTWASNWWPRYREGNYRYADGYLYRYQSSGIVDGFVPLAGGALWRGNVWPTSYSYAPVPTYLSQYYGWNQPYDYRYADGIVYGLDPQTQMIQQVAGLLTGDTFNIGQTMPAGYDVYNVPYAYRGQYYDTPQSQYRYSDGYIYQMDPTTQLVQAAIQLLT